MTTTPTTTYMTEEIELRLAALDRAIALHAQQDNPGTAEDVAATANRFVAYLREEKAS